MDARVRVAVERGGWYRGGCERSGRVRLDLVRVSGRRGGIGKFNWIGRGECEV